MKLVPIRFTGRLRDYSQNYLETSISVRVTDLRDTQVVHRCGIVELRFRLVTVPLHGLVDCRVVERVVRTIGRRARLVPSFWCQVVVDHVVSRVVASVV